MSRLNKKSVRAVSVRRKIAGYAVHLFTASGAAVGAITMTMVMRGSYREAFLLMTLAVIIDAVDGSLARWVQVRVACPNIDGRRLDDIVDYINYTLTPILMLCHASWLPEPILVWAAIPLVASLFAFAHCGAKEETAGFFRGFPSYWNVVAFYVAVWLHTLGPLTVLGIVLLLSLLSVLPVRFVYPNRPPCWRWFFVGGGLVWLLILVYMLLNYPHVSPFWLVASLIYPILYVVLSVVLDIRERLVAADGRRR